MDTPYVEQRDQGYWITGERVSLDSIVLAFLDGLSPETIALECFSTLSLEQIYGAIAYYLRHKREIDEYLERSDVDFESFRQSLHQSEPNFVQRLALVRRQTLAAV